MTSLVKFIILFFCLVFFFKMSWIWWPAIAIGGLTLYIAYIYAQADELQRLNIRYWLDDIPYIFYRLFV